MKNRETDRVKKELAALNAWLSVGGMDRNNEDDEDKDYDNDDDEATVCFLIFISCQLT